MPKNRTKFNASWLNKYDNNSTLIGEWCTESKSSESNALCKLCHTEFSVANQGIIQIKQHSSGKKHLEKVKSLENQLELNIAKSSKNSTEPSTMYSFNLVSHKDQLVKAEVIWGLKVVAQNWSFASCDGIGNTFRAMFPGSIADGFNISHSKISYLISEGLGPYFHSQMLSDLKTSSSQYFSIQYDETTNKQNKKELMLKIRFWSKNSNEVMVRHLESFLLGHAKGEDLSKHILKSLDSNGLSLQKLVSLGSDGPNVNKKVWRLINKEVVDSRGPCSLMDISSCNLHTLNNALKKGLLQIGDDVSDLAILVFYWFKQSSARMEDFEEIQLKLGAPPNKFIKHVEVRWLTLGPSANRLLEQLTPLKEYFLKEMAKNAVVDGNKKYTEICRILRKPAIEAEINLVASACETFSRCMKFFQKEEPMIHLLYEEVRDLAIIILSKIVNDVVLKQNKFQLHKMDLKKDNSIFLPLEKMDLALAVTRSISYLKEKDKKCFLLSCQAFYINIADHIIKKTCLSNQLVKHLRFLKPEEIKKNRSLDDLLKVVKLMPLDENVKFGTALTEEWKLLQFEEFDPMETNRIGEIKSNLNTVKYPNVMKGVKLALVLPHGNAEVERGFSKSGKVVTAERQTCL